MRNRAVEEGVQATAVAVGSLAFGPGVFTLREAKHFRWQRRVDARPAEFAVQQAAGGEGCVHLGCEALRPGLKDKRGDRLEGGELGGRQVPGDVDGTVIDKLLQPKACSDVEGSFVPFSASTRMSGVDLDGGRQLRKGATASVSAWVPYMLVPAGLPGCSMSVPWIRSLIR